MKLINLVEAFKDVQNRVKENGELGDKISHRVDNIASQSIRRYTDDSRVHNDLLHRRYHGAKGGSLEDSVYDDINSLQKTIHEQEQLQGIHVFSGVHTDVDALFSSNHIKPFSELEFFVPSFTSTTTSLAAVDSYAKLYNVSTASPELKRLLQQHSHDIKTYRNVLCFDLHGKKALKIDSHNGGVFGDHEKEFILPHSTTVRIKGVPSITFGERQPGKPGECALLIWDAEVVKTEAVSDILPEHDADLRKLDMVQFKTAVFGILNTADVNIDDKAQYNVIRYVSRLERMYHDTPEHRVPSSGREMTFFEEYFINYIVLLKNEGYLEKYLPKIRKVFKILNASKASLMSAPLSDTIAKTELAKLLDLIFDHG